MSGKKSSSTTKKRASSKATTTATRKRSSSKAAADRRATGSTKKGTKTSAKASSKKGTRKRTTKKSTTAPTSGNGVAATPSHLPHPKHVLAVRGASLHNLKNISLDLPKNRLIVVTGLSGSGKSSLAFNTIYAEGQRRYVESLSSYARQFLSRMAKPQVESISGLAPAVAIEQQVLQRSPRSTVATTTEVYDYLRLLFGRVGRTYCKNDGTEVRRDTPRTVQDRVADLPTGARLTVLFPLPDHEGESVDHELEALRARGFFRIVVGESTDIEDLTEDDTIERLSEHEKEDLFVLVDRIAWKQKDEGSLSRLAEAAESGFREGDGTLILRRIDDDPVEHRFSRRFECSTCATPWLEPTPRLFSFNNPYGACPECQGFGRAVGIDMDLVFPDRSRTLAQGAIQPFTTPKHSKHYHDLQAIAREAGVRLDVPVCDLTEEETEIVMSGHGDYLGVDGFFSMVEKKTYKMHYRIFLARYRGYTTCPRCKGGRLRTSALQVFVGGKRISEVTAMTIDRAKVWFDELELSKYEQDIADRVLDEIRKRLHFLVEVGLGYIRLDRLSHTLSGGEMQRINLATSIGSALVGAMYVLDEPSIGLHPRDTNRLINILKELRDLGNTVIVVEHDPDMIRAADVVLELGPDAGEQGGDVVYLGDLKGLLAKETSRTGQRLQGRSSSGNGTRERRRPTGMITLSGANLHNLRNVTVDIPLGVMTAVTGVSGSGKSTLVHDVLWPTLTHRLGEVGRGHDRGASVEGVNRIGSVEMIDQSPIGRTPRSNPATYTKAFDAIRDLFAATSYARVNGWKPGYFSFNVPGGRCDVCDGDGSVTVDMQFLADVQLPCDSCGGSRYKTEVLKAKFKGKTVVDVLEMTVAEAIEFFEGEGRITNRLNALDAVGLGYVRLGQPATTLSGGEAQRVKLASHLSGRPGSETLFILDEPTTGLHMADVDVLLGAFDALIEAGNTILVIEHNLDVIAASDQVIDLGPEGGDAGGRVVAVGTPEEIAGHEDSITGRFLSEVLD